jgi:LuxR family maltose regulon positive regulatory protein
MNEAMSGDLLQTKLYVPRLRPSLVSRPHLIKKLNAGLGGKLTLISASAGFGKTTLVSAWVHKSNKPVAWLSLEESDNDLHRFLTYFIAAIQTIASDVGESPLAALQTPGGVNVEDVLTKLLNEINASTVDMILVLDDYHVIESQPIDAAILFLLDHLPPQLHLVIASRIDPSLPLSRLRVRGQMTEIRAHDLRFSLEETAVFLKQIVDFELSDQEVAALGTRTEGWVAGLQLAALSMQGFEQNSDIADFVDKFTGSDRYIQDYLTEETLQRQPPHIKDFLLQTSILRRLSAPLCNAIMGSNDSQAILETLDAANLFIVPLDNERRWFRYHHLFADLLRQQCRQSYPEQIAGLNGRASEWYAQNGFTEEAIKHALYANDFERAASLAELAWPAWHGSIQSLQWLGWLKALPDDAVRARPVLSLGYAWAYLNAGNLEAAASRLRDVEQWLEPTTDKGVTKTSPEQGRRMVVVDEAQFRALPMSLATARAYHAQAIGDVNGTVKYAQRALDLMPPGDSYDRGTITALLGLAQWTSGDLEAAHRTFANGLASMNPLDVIVGTFVLADIKMTLGHLHEAVNICQHTLQLAAEQEEPFPLGTEDVYSGISELHREQGDLEAAAQDLATSKKLGEQIELPDWQYRWYIAQARLKETLGDLEGALNLLHKAESVFVRTPLPKTRPIPALKARVWVKQGNLAEAEGWARACDLSAADDLSFLREFEHITLARLFIAQYKSDTANGSIHEAMELLNRLLQAAEAGGRMGSVTEILTLQALAHEAQGDIPSALVPLGRALNLAKPEGYVRIFVDEGLPMAKLLQALANQGIESDYTRQLLAAFKPIAKSDTETVAQPLVEPLSERELEVLQLIAQGLTNREISGRLFLALDTVKGHNRRIFGKLGVKNRAQAVNKAISLKILPPQ